MTPAHTALFHGACFAVGGCVGMFGAFYYAFLATDTPGTWFARRVRLRA